MAYQYEIRAALQLGHLRSFVAVASELHFGRAAANLYVSQSALSQQIRLLERCLGFSLLDRTTRQVKLTAAGLAFLPHAQDVVRHADVAVLAARDIATGHVGHLRVGYHSAGDVRLPTTIVNAFRTQFPRVTITPSFSHSANNLERLRRAELDVTFARLPMYDMEDVAYRVIESEVLVLALPGEHPLAQLRSIPPDMVHGEPFVIWPRENNRAFFDVFLAWLREATGDGPNVLREEPSEEAMVAAVAAGAGISVATQSRARQLQVDGVTYRPFTVQPPVGDLAVLWRCEDISPVVDGFLSVVDEVTRRVASDCLDQTGSQSLQATPGVLEIRSNDE